MPLRLAPVEPRAPHLISASIAFLLTHPPIHPLAEVPQRRELAALDARPFDRLDGLIADALDGIQAEADAADRALGAWRADRELVGLRG